MAGKFFNQRVKGSSNNNMKAYMIVGGCILIIFIVVIIIVSVGGDDNSPDAVIEVQDSISVEINGDLPDNTDFFSELQNVKEDDIDVDYSGVDMSKLGSYDVTITVNNHEYTSTLNVIDETAPELTTKDLTINIGQTYNAEDFVDTCTDNSGEECVIEFYENGRDQDGNLIEYGSYLAEGTYQIQIIASDSSENATQPQTATLIIGEGGGTVDPSTCRYGGSEYDSNTYILGVNVTNNGCALDLNLYHEESTQQAAKDLAETDTEKLQKEIYNLNIDKNIIKNLTQRINPVLNTTGTGLVGYTVEMILTLEYTDGTTEVVERYFLDQNGKRTYSINKYNLS